MPLRIKGDSVEITIYDEVYTQDLLPQIRKVFVNEERRFASVVLIPDGRTPVTYYINGIGYAVCKDKIIQVTPQKPVDVHDGFVLRFSFI